MPKKIFLRKKFDFVGRVICQIFQKSFSCHLEFLHKIQKRIYLGNGVRLGDFDEIFSLLGMCSRLTPFAKNHFLAIFVAMLNFCISRWYQIEQFQRNFGQHCIGTVIYQFLKKLFYKFIIETIRTYRNRAERYMTDKCILKVY